MAGDLCVDVAKYSHATGVRPDNSIPWTHLTGSGIFVVLKRNGSGGGDGDNLELRVVQGTSVLENVHVSDLIDSAIAARQGSQQAGIAPQVEQLPIFGITKDVLLALRYRVVDGQARRIQFRMQSAADCIRVVEILQRRGMEFQQQRPRTARPDTANSNIRPMTTTSSFSTSTRCVPADTITPSPFQPQTLEAGSLSAGSRQISARPESRQALYPNTLDDSSRAVAPPMIPRSDPQYQGPSGSTPHPMNAPPFTSFPVSTGDTRNVMEKRAPTASHAPSEASDFFFQRPPAMHSSQQPSLQTSHGIEATSSNPIWPNRQPDHGFPSANDENQGMSRPTTARSAIAASFTMPMTLEHEIPPPRKLPFERSGSSRPTTAASATAVDPVHPGDTSTTHGSIKKSTIKKPHAMSRPTTASPLKRSFAAVENEHENERPQTAIAPIGRRPSPVKTGSGGEPNTGSGSTMRRPSNVGEMMRTMRPLAERSPNANEATRMKSLADANYELETPPRTSSSSHRGGKNNEFSSPTRRKGGERDTTLTTYAAIQQPDETSSLARYAAHSRPDRTAILDEFMISKLEDAAFTDLAEDVDACWRRMQLGL